ncbi:MAG: type I phosphomannose isomerase catalytic subunit [Janthinobacterium lividum]
MSQPTSAVEPIALEPILVERIWGVDDLAPWHEASTDGKAIGEIWLTAETCQAGPGAVAGRTLADLTAAAPEVFGDPRHEGFPLLIKLLFPREKLSVQVHPNDTEAQALGMPRGKTECWYVLQAEPGAEVAVGFREPLRVDEVAASIQDGSIESKLRMIPVKAGDMVFVDAGTVHAIGPGMVVLETQQYSDTTYRLWDYGRPRELHVEAGMQVTRTSTKAGLVQPERMDGFTRLVTSEYFTVDHFSLMAGVTQPLGETGRLQILIALREGAALQREGAMPVALPRGQAVVIPVQDQAFVLQSNGDVEVVRVLQP